jgi:outer membrane biosynthesis protein TonB
MSKLGKLKLELAKLLASFSELKTDKGILSWPVEGEIEIGFDVYVLDENGEYIAPEDGDYVTEDGKTITLANGKVEAITEPETEAEVEPEPEPEAEETVEAAEEPVVEPTVEPEAEVVEDDGIRKEIDALYEVVNQLVKKVAELEGKTNETSETVVKMSKMSAAMSAQEEIETNAIAKSGDSAIDRKLKNFIG